MSRPIYRFSRSPALFLTALCALFLVLSGCAKQQQVGQARIGQDVFVDIDAPDVMVEQYVPI
ncbi:MAG: hypothetical protein LIP28_08700 [Deltaproteobacteria bacterium]|nr:hypothetical protein [Deltaproteobacteria bacterium]